ncbi:hypothetical protein CYMTET_42296 [Cymbomonas tetramitiformis]|uniref:Uncharacterized protein n=1 Tax=Cymbomonas tetramitiformis TaxID=36881 RepID=A0AAE0C6C8_9CHLO|nr:hypothetical protein CYMTET_42296 [Cymbomonas tetramitiformis]
MDASGWQGGIAYRDRRHILSFPPEECAPYKNSNFHEASTAAWAVEILGPDMLGKKDYSDWQYRADEFSTLSRLVGHDFTLDEGADPVGTNAYVQRIRSVVDSFLDRDVRGEHVYANPDFTLIGEYLAHFQACQQRAPQSTSGTFVLPVWDTFEWWPLLKGARVLKYYPEGSHLFTSPEWRHLGRDDGTYGFGDERAFRGPTQWPVVVVYYPPTLCSRSGVAAAQAPRGAGLGRDWRSLPVLSGDAARDRQLLCRAEHLRGIRDAQAYMRGYLDHGLPATGTDVVCYAAHSVELRELTLDSSSVRYSSGSARKSLGQWLWTWGWSHCMIVDVGGWYTPKVHVSGFSNDFNTWCVAHQTGIHVADSSVAVASVQHTANWAEQGTLRASDAPSEIDVDSGGVAMLLGNDYRAVHLEVRARCSSGAVTGLLSDSDTVIANPAPTVNDVDLGNMYGRQFPTVVAGEAVDVAVWVETGGATLNLFDVLLTFDPDVTQTGKYLMGSVDSSSLTTHQLQQMDPTLDYLRTGTCSSSSECSNSACPSENSICPNRVDSYFPLLAAAQKLHFLTASTAAAIVMAPATPADSFEISVTIKNMASELISDASNIPVTFEIGVQTSGTTTNQDMKFLNGTSPLETANGVAVNATFMGDGVFTALAIGPQVEGVTEFIPETGLAVVVMIQTFFLQSGSQQTSDERAIPFYGSAMDPYGSLNYAYDPLTIFDFVAYSPPPPCPPPPSPPPPIPTTATITPPLLHHPHRHLPHHHHPPTPSFTAISPTTAIPHPLLHRPRHHHPHRNLQPPPHSHLHPPIAPTAATTSHSTTVEEEQLALIDMDSAGEGGFLTQASEHGGGPRGSPLESGATPARALELAVQGVAGMARASGRVGGPLDALTEGPDILCAQGEGASGSAGAGSQASTQNLSVDDILVEVDEPLSRSLVDPRRRATDTSLPAIAASAVWAVTSACWSSLRNGGIVGTAMDEEEVGVRVLVGTLVAVGVAVGWRKAAMLETLSVKLLWWVKQLGKRWWGSGWASLWWEVVAGRACGGR